MSQLVLCISLCPAVTSSSWHFQAEKKLHSTIRLFKLSDYSKRGHWLPAWVSPRKFSLPITLLILGKCTWAGCTESALFCSSQSFFFVMHVLHAGRGVEVGKRDTSFGGSTPALHRWRWSMGRSCTALVHLLWPTTCWRKAHIDWVFLACLLSYLPMQLGWLLRGNVGSSICLKHKTKPKSSLTKWPFPLLR